MLKRFFFFYRSLENLTRQVDFCFVIVMLANNLHDIKMCPWSWKAHNTMCSTFFFFFIYASLFEYMSVLSSVKENTCEIVVPP